MIGLSVWIFRDKEKLSLVDKHVISIINNNQQFFSKYYIITNKKENFNEINKNLIFIEERELMIHLRVFGIKNMPRDHQLSDVGTLWADQIITAFTLLQGKEPEPVLYVDADFLLTNHIIVKDLETHVKDYSLFYDKGFYRSNGMNDKYINAALAFFPIDKRYQYGVLEEMRREQVRRLNCGEDKEYNDVGPRLLYKFKDKLVIQENVEPNTPPFGEFCPRNGIVESITVKYNPRSLGVHVLFSLFKVCKTQVEEIMIRPSEVEFLVKGIDD